MFRFIEMWKFSLDYIEMLTQSAYNLFDYVYV